MAINIGQKMQAQVRMSAGAQRSASHCRTQIRTANPDVDDIRNALTSEARPAAIADFVGEGRHARQHRLNIGTDFVAIEDETCIRRLPQAGMQGGTVFGRVDAFPSQHGVPQGFNTALPRKLGEQTQGIVPQMVF